MNAHLQANRQELLEAFKQLKKFAKAQKGVEAIWSYGEGQLTIQCAGLAVRIAAVGEWPGEARIPGSALAGLARALLSPLWLDTLTDPLPVTVSDGHLRLSTFSVECVWTEAVANRIVVAMNESLVDLLAIRQQHSDAEIEHAGITSAVREAERKRDVLIAEATEGLWPLGVTKEDLMELVQATVRRHAADRNDTAERRA